MTQDQLDLLHGYLNSTLDEADFARFQSLLRDSAEARRTLRSLSTVEAKLTQLAAIHPETVRLLSETARESRPSARWLSWRPLTAAAAGIALGMFCTSVVFGYVGPRVAEKVKVVFAEGFESGVTKTEPGLSREVGHWSGDEAEVVKTASEMKAHGGAKMLRFLSATYPGENSPRSQWGDVYRIVDVRGLAGAGLTATRVSASFARGTVDAEAQFSCSVEAMALEQDLSELPSRLDLMWLRQHSSAAGLRKVALSSAQEWKQVSVEVPITPETRYVILHLAIVQDRPALESGVVQFPGHFMDDVKVELITRP